MLKAKKHFQKKNSKSSRPLLISLKTTLFKNGLNASRSKGKSNEQNIKTKSYFRNLILVTVKLSGTVMNWPFRSMTCMKEKYRFF